VTLQEEIAEALGKRKYGPNEADYRHPSHSRWRWLMELAAVVLPVVERNFAERSKGRAA
jgi:hypothetical protein